MKPQLKCERKKSKTCCTNKNKYLTKTLSFAFQFYSESR